MLIPDNNMKIRVSVANLAYFLEQRRVGDWGFDCFRKEQICTHSPHCPTEVFTYLSSLKCWSFIGCSYRFIQLQWLQESKHASVYVWWRVERNGEGMNHPRWWALITHESPCFALLTRHILFSGSVCRHGPLEAKRQIWSHIWGETACELR